MFGPPGLSFADMLGDEFDTKILDQTMGISNAPPLSEVSLPFLSAQNEIGKFSSQKRNKIVD